MNYFKTLTFCLLASLFISVIIYLSMAIYFTTFDLHYFSGDAKWMLGFCWVVLSIFSFPIAALIENHKL